MERSSFSILFSIRESKARKNGNTPIEVTITINGERCSFSTGKQIKVTSWDKNRQLVKGKDEEATSLNNYLKSVRAKLYEKEAELLDRGFIITAQLLYDAYFDKVECLKERSLLSVLEEHNTERKAMVGKTVAPATYWIFEYTGRLLREFILKKYNREDLYLRELNIGFIQGFHSFLLSEKKMGQNSCTKHLKFLKKLLNLAVANSYISYNYLKDIAILCGINKRICFHTSRHTFASTVTLANNISLEVVSKMLGHTNTRMTAHYAKLIDKCIGEQMDKLMDTFTGDSDY